MAEKVILVAVQRQETDEQFEYALEELARLSETAGGQVVSVVTQKREKFDHRTLIGKGKLAELVNLVGELKPDTLIFQNELSPSQVRNIQEEIDCKVLDRVQLILDIFALRARSKEGKLQVALAQLNYLLPRLSGQGKNMSRLGGGIGTRGPGETKLESDRRHIQTQISEYKKQLKEVSLHRERARVLRKESHVFQLGLIGYTNAGKSTILNRLSDANTYEKDQLFATLDPLTRQITLLNQFKMTLTDTVGFIQDIPTQLIHAFESTLEESGDVDLLIHVVDASAENYQSHQETVQSLFVDLNMDNIPMLTVYNKKDKATVYFTPTLVPNCVISALDTDDIKYLEKVLWEQIKMQLVPYELTFSLGEEYKVTRVTEETFVESSTFDADRLVYVLKGFAKPTSQWVQKKEDNFWEKK